jgi:hypothetical protein
VRASGCIARASLSTTPPSECIRRVYRGTGCESECPHCASGSSQLDSEAMRCGFDPPAQTTTVAPHETIPVAAKQE